MPAPDPRLHHGPVTLPEDPTGIAEPHDVLAAEEFALPAPVTAAGVGRPFGSARRRRAAPLALGLLLAVVVVRLLRRTSS